MTNPNDRVTTVRVPQGSDVQVSGAGTIRVLVVSNDGDGQFGYRDVPCGSRVGDVLPKCVNKVLVNGKFASVEQQLNDGDKVSEQPENVEGA